ncbi:hypothetical protein BH24ACT23_BH24ACT23_10820 [soil metagenome]
MRAGSLRVGGLVVAQTPNPPLIAAAIAWIVALLADGGSTLEHVSRAVFYVALTAWAWEEFTQGVNWFRRTLGAGGLVLAVVSIAVALG